MSDWRYQLVQSEMREKVVYPGEKVVWIWPVRAKAGGCLQHVRIMDTASRGHDCLAKLAGDIQILQHRHTPAPADYKRWSIAAPFSS